MNKNNEIFVTFLLTIIIHLTKKAQITFLITKKVKISVKYSDFLDIFLEKQTLILLKITKLNQYTIEL